MVLLLLCLSLSASLEFLSDTEAEKEFNKFKLNFNKHYSFSDSHYRYKVFKENLEYIKEINSKSLGFKLEIGPNADQTHEELTNEAFTFPVGLNSPLKIYSTSSLPSSVDWVQAGKVSSLKTIKNCKASWAFAATDTIESIVSITKNSSVVKLSTQQIISCSNSYGNLDCISGSLNNTYSYALANCLTSDSQYSFVDKASTCKKSVVCQAKVSDFSMVSPNNEIQLKAAVAVQPVAVTLNVPLTLAHYGSGILPASWCGNSTGYSNFVVVGYGTIATTDYWIIRSYWGASWGLGGYALLERKDSNTPGACGIASTPYIPLFTP
jgi:C1A family cysteine protease